MTTAFAIVRAAHFICLMTLFGMTAFLWLARGIGVTRAAQARRMLIASAVVALLTAAAWLVFVSRELAGVSVPDLDLLTDVATKSYYGKVAVWRFVMLIALCEMAILGHLTALRLPIAGAALALLGMTSHAAAAGDPALILIRAGVDAAHLLAAGFWVGGLAVLAHEVTANPRDTKRLVALLRLFSRWGVAAVAVLLVAGTLNGVFILGAGDRWSNAYVTLLAFKIVLAALMVGLALTNRFGVLPGLERGDKEAGETIPLTVVAELSCAALILVIVGFLGVTPPMQM